MWINSELFSSAAMSVLPAQVTGTKMMHVVEVYPRFSTQYYSDIRADKERKEK